MLLHLERAAAPVEEIQMDVNAIRKGQSIFAMETTKGLMVPAVHRFVCPYVFVESPIFSFPEQIRQQNAAGNKAAAVAAAANGSKLSAKVDSIFSEVTHYGIEDQSGTR